tara:strand:- start:2229 stop:3203 length:975 start_codon:yes stop_codon:yes gene_type:complete
MDGGAFRVFLLILASTVELWADGVAVPAVTTNATTTATNAVSIITTNAPSVTTNTVLVPEVVGLTNSPSVTTNIVLVPEVVGSTNAPPVASGTNSVAEVKQEIPANLGVFSVIPRKDPFRLTKPEPEEAEPEIVAPRTVGVPQLAGISTLRGNQRAVLRISPPRGGKAEYVFLAVGDELHGVEVTKIDLSQGLVEVFVRGQTFPLELDKKSDAGNGSTVSMVRPSGSNYRPGIGGEAEKPSKAGDNPKPPSGNGLKPVPTRSPSPIQPSLEYPAPFGTGRFEPPQFDQRLQKYLTDPASLSTQREIVRGQVSSESPTDIPKYER